MNSLIIFVLLVALLLTGMPISIALGMSVLAFLYAFSTIPVEIISQRLFTGLDQFAIMAIPFFILAGAFLTSGGVATRIVNFATTLVGAMRGGLALSAVLSCAFFAALSGSSPATVVAIGSIMIPAMVKQGYPKAFGVGVIATSGGLGILIPPSIVMILYAVAAEQSLGRLFLAGIGPGILLVALFSGYAAYRFKKEYREAHATWTGGGEKSAYLDTTELTFADKTRMLPRVIPFVTLLIGVMVVLYGGYATPSETAGLGGLLALFLIAVIYKVWRPSQLSPILTSTLKESTMLMFIIGMSLLYSYVMSYLHISQSAAESIVALSLSKWALLTVILLLVVVLGFFLPPVSIILMTAPIILPPLKAAGFDLIWFGVVMTIVMEMGLIHPPVGLNIFIIKNIAPDIPLKDIIWGVIPFVALMAFAVLLICFVPGIATWLPDVVFGVSGK